MMSFDKAVLFEGTQETITAQPINLNKCESCENCNQRVKHEATVSINKNIEENPFNQNTSEVDSDIDEPYDESEDRCFFCCAYGCFSCCLSFFGICCLVLCASRGRRHHLRIHTAQ